MTTTFSRYTVIHEIKAYETKFHLVQNIFLYVEELARYETMNLRDLLSCIKRAYTPWYASSPQSTIFKIKL